LNAATRSWKCLRFARRQKLFQLLRQMGETGSAKIGDLADLLKSG